MSDDALREIALAALRARSLRLAWVENECNTAHGRDRGGPREAECIDAECALDDVLTKHCGDAWDMQSPEDALDKPIKVPA